VAWRQSFTAELEQLRLQVEVMAVRVDENLERMRTVLRDGDEKVAAVAVAGDDEIDAMRNSLAERCYDLLCRENPVASDLRLIVSVLRVLEELERIGDLALRVVKLAPDQPLLARQAPIFTVLVAMADEAAERYRTALTAWAAQDLRLATELSAQPRRTDLLQDQLSRDILALDGPDAVPTAVKAFYAGRSLERIVDHTDIIGARLRFLLTGDPSHIASEVR
jgi:phosphate transport system protein